MDVAAVDDDSNTALHLAASKGHYSVALSLLNNEADVTARYINAGTSTLSSLS